jgi:hypothetical protein
MTMLLRSLAFVFGAGIATFGALLLSGRDDPALLPVPDDAAAASPPAAGAPAHDATAHAPAVAPSASPAPEAPTSASGNETPSRGTVLYGRVTDAAGAAIPEGFLGFTRAGGSAQLASVSLSPRDTTFAIAGIAPGEATYRSRAAGFRELEGKIVIPEGTPSLRHDIVLQPSWLLSVKILTPEGTPLHEALRTLAGKERPNLHRVEVGAVVSTERPDGDFAVTGLREITAGIGRWRAAHGFEAMRSEKQAPKDVAGVIEIDEPQPLWVSAVMRHRVLASVAVEPGQREVTLTLATDAVLKDLGTIRGRLVDAATRAPITSKPRVGFGDQQSGGGGRPIGDDGRFEGTDLRPGLLQIEVLGKDAHMNQMVRLEPGQVLDLGDVPVAARRTIQGRCEGMASGGRLGMSTMALDPPAHPAFRHDRGHVQVASDGSFTMYVTEGRHRVRASGAGGAVIDIDTKAVGEQPLVVHLAKEANVRLDVQTKGAPMELALFDGSGREVYRRDLQHGWKFALPFLPGTYRVELKDGHGKVTTRSLTLGEGGADLRVP